MSALRLINETTASSVSSVSVNDIFTSDFDIYKVVLTEFQVVTSGVEGRLRFVNSSGSVVSSQYDYAYLDMPSFTTFSEGRATGQTFLQSFTKDTRGSSETGGFVMYVFNPTNSSSYTFILHQDTFYNTGNGQQGNKGIGVHKSAQSITGLNFFCSSGNIDNIALKVYGLRVDNG